MGGFGYSYKTLEDKVRFHRKRAQYHENRAAEWEHILSQIQQLQRLEQASAEAEPPKLAPTKKTARSRTRNDFARELLEQRVKDGITPGEVRKLANQQGFSVPNNYPYKLFTLLAKQRKVRKDETGRYFPIAVSDKK